MWQDSNIGNYVEFKVQVTYHEGHESGTRQSLGTPHHSGDPSNMPTDSMNQWLVYKRYSNFVDLHDVCLPFYKAEGIQLAKLPPKIANEATSQRNLALT